MAGRFEKAIVVLNRVLHRNPDYLSAWVNLAVIYSSLGRGDKARAAVAEVLRLDPKFSLEHYAKTLTYKNQAESERLIDALRNAGLK
ncbi:MAG: tetratricopeptide repeat protein, partial [Deltaproteobacteria bacterium]|nr:tetratricopeptide repeat protein [Deltaproteobacteria bacterium]